VYFLLPWQEYGGRALEIDAKKSGHVWVPAPSSVDPTIMRVSASYVRRSEIDLEKYFAGAKTSIVLTVHVQHQVSRIGSPARKHIK
jgi:hypothetical protein